MPRPRRRPAATNTALPRTAVSRAQRQTPATAISNAEPPATPGALGRLNSSERRSVVEVATAFSLPLPALAAVAGGAFGGPFDLGGGELQAGPDLISLDLGHRPLLAFRGLPGALAEAAGDHDPVALGQRVGQ